MVWYDGMPVMTHRTTFALDRETAQRLKRLSKKWKVSQAEVVRRSVKQAEVADAQPNPDPVDLLSRLHEEGGGMAREAAEAYLGQVRRDRKQWRKDPS